MMWLAKHEHTQGRKMAWSAKFHVKEFRSNWKLSYPLFWESQAGQQIFINMTQFWSNYCSTFQNATKLSSSLLMTNNNFTLRQSMTKGKQSTNWPKSVQILRSFHVSTQYLVHSRPTQLMNTWNKMEQLPVANWKMSERKSLEIAYVQAPT